MPVGMILLVIVGALIYFGTMHRILDRMRLTDKGALLFLGLMIIGSYISFTVLKSPAFVTINLGGIAPVFLAIYVLSKANTSKEIIRGILSSLVTAGIIYGISKAFTFEPGIGRAGFLDPMYTYAIIAGIVAYISSRSRRSAFIAGTTSIILMDLFSLIELSVRGVRGRVDIGGGGSYDAVIIAGIIAVALAEIIGETRERLQGGPVSNADRTEDMKVEISEELSNTNPPEDKTEEGDRQ